ncbi:MAG: NUDIX hydrolase [Paracoccus sp. (in: a-proteobacteria)]|uniref:NUDIX hydrolase n=1 Tax=Paracoccus sp. TaxID=267 RepID=UPI0026DFAB0C|nr:NUDIX hydrolase [Paracoccus sp. (in: a-proteobacteria)]MDO5620814.1 NUDIX hydrolase [Paracoccus sp. (in: a-proteobacteria)]
MPLGSESRGEALSGAKIIATCGPDLLTYRRDNFDHIPWPDHWDLPGGGAEPGEAAEACALRELAEEFGLTLPPNRLLIRQDYTPSHQPGRYAAMFTLHLTRAEIASIRFGNEGQEWQMMPVTDYLNHPCAIPHFQARIRAILDLR